MDCSDGIAQGKAPRQEACPLAGMKGMYSFKTCN